MRYEVELINLMLRVPFKLTYLGIVGLVALSHSLDNTQLIAIQKE